MARPSSKQPERTFWEQLLDARPPGPEEQQAMDLAQIAENTQGEAPMPTPPREALAAPSLMGEEEPEMPVQAPIPMPPPQAPQTDLTPWAALVDTWTGSNFAPIALAQQKNQQRQIATQGAAQQQAQKFKSQAAGNLRKEYLGLPLTKETQSVLQSYGRVQNTPLDRAGDLALVYNFMKMLDPGSVVRESEFSVAQNVGSLPQNMQAIVLKWLDSKSGTLPPEIRSQFLNTARRMRDAQLQTQEQAAKYYRGLSGRYGIPDQDVVVPFGKEEPGQSNDLNAKILEGLRSIK